ALRRAISSSLRSRRQSVYLLSPPYGDPRDLHSFPTRRSSDLKQNPTSCKHMYCRYEHEHLRTDYAAAQPEQIRLTYKGWNIGFGTFRSDCFHDGVLIGRTIDVNLSILHLFIFMTIHIYDTFYH